jgi:hypothetical protein
MLHEKDCWEKGWFKKQAGMGYVPSLFGMEDQRNFLTVWLGSDWWVWISACWGLLWWT